MHDNHINVGRLIFKKLKAITDVKQQTFDHLCIINELCRLVGVRSHPEDDMIQIMVPINMFLCVGCQ